MTKIIDLSGKFGTHTIVLDKKRMEVKIFGAFRTRGDEQKECRVTIIHKAAHTKAETTLKGVVEDHSQLKLFGTIIVEKRAQQTNSFLRERILLLSPQSKAEAVPNLEIQADDVKCSHAATISNIPEEQLFYLMSRGLTRKKAEEMIVEGFLAR